MNGVWISYCLVILLGLILFILSVSHPYVNNTGLRVFLRSLIIVGVIIFIIYHLLVPYVVDK